jgi:hypothetical protein
MYTKVLCDLHYIHTSLTYIYPLTISRCHLFITLQDGVPIFYMAPMEGKETPTNINMGLYRK